MIKIILITILALAQKYPETREKKFDSGKIKSKTLFVGFNDIESSEVFYANGKMKFKYVRKEKSKDPFKSDIYKYQEWTDTGLMAADGDCHISPSEDFDPESYCSKYSGVLKSYDKEKKLISEVNLVKGLQEGETRLFEKEFNWVLHYKNGKLTKKLKIDPATQKVLKTEEYLEDGSIAN